MMKLKDANEENKRLHELLRERDQTIDLNRRRLLDALGKEDGYAQVRTFADLLLIVQGLRVEKDTAENRSAAVSALLRVENAKLWHLLRGKMEDPTLLEKGDEKNRPQPTPFDMTVMEGLPMPVMRFN